MRFAFTALLFAFILHPASLIAQRADTTSTVQPKLTYRYIELQEKASWHMRRSARDLTISLGSAVAGGISSILIMRYGGEHKEKAAITTGSLFGSVTIGFAAGAIWNINRSGKYLKESADELRKM